MNPFEGAAKHVFQKGMLRTIAVKVYSMLYMLSSMLQNKIT